MKQCFVAWTPYIRRPDSMRDFFGYELHFIAISFKYRLLKPFEYIVKMGLTLWLLARKRPDVVWIQLAPSLLLYIAFAYKWLLRRRCAIVADCHNSMLSGRWLRMPGALRLLNRCDRILVHNAKAAAQAEKAGIRKLKMEVLETRPAQIEEQEPQTEEQGPQTEVREPQIEEQGPRSGVREPQIEEQEPRTGVREPQTGEKRPRIEVREPEPVWADRRSPFVLHPCSFDPDEPIRSVFAAACMIPDIRFVITGNAARAQGVHRLEGIPANVTLAGFLPKAEFNRCLLRADLVLGLTTRDDIQLSVANEAVGFCRPMVISDTPLLKSLFYKGAVYVDSLRPESISSGCVRALADRRKLEEEVVQLKRERNQRWLEQAGKIRIHEARMQEGLF